MARPLICSNINWLLKHILSFDQEWQGVENLKFPSKAPVFAAFLENEYFFVNSPGLAVKCHPERGEGSPWGPITWAV